MQFNDELYNEHVKPTENMLWQGNTDDRSRLSENIKAYDAIGLLFRACHYEMQ